MESPKPHGADTGWGGRVGALVALAAAVAVFAVLAVQHRWYADETFVAFRQASNLAHGEGYVWNPGGPRVEAAPAPGWIGLAAAAIAVRTDPVLFAWYFGSFCGIGVLLLLYVAGRALLGLPPWWAVVAPATLAAHRYFVSNAVGADATRPATLLILCGTILLGGLAQGSRDGLRRIPSPATFAVASGLFFFIATLLLPATPLLHAAAAAGMLLARPGRERAMTVGTSLGAHAAMFLGLTLVRVMAFGHALPPRAAGPLTEGVSYLGQFPAETHGWLWLPLLLAGLALLGTRLPDFAAALLVQIVAVCGLVAARGATGPAYVALDPALPAYALLLPPALREILRLRGEQPSARRSMIIALLTLGIVGTQASTSLRPAPEVADASAAVPRPRALQHATDDALGEAQLLARYLGPADRIATGSRGAVPYVTRAWHVPLRPVARALGERVLAAGIYGAFLFDRPYPPARVPSRSVAEPPAGTAVFCLRLPAGPRPYWIFASALSEAEVRRWASAKGLEFVYADVFAGAAAPAPTGTIGAPAGG